MARGKTMTALQRIRRWQKKRPGRKVYFGTVVVAIAENERSVTAKGNTAEEAAAEVMRRWREIR